MRFFHSILDMIEPREPRAGQNPRSPRAGLFFCQALRSHIRSDPDPENVIRQAVGDAASAGRDAAGQGEEAGGVGRI